MIVTCTLVIVLVLILVAHRLDQVRAGLATINTQQGRLMAAIDDLQKAQAAEKADLAALGALITQLLTAFVNGTITPTQASDLLNEMNAEDATIQTNIASIQTTLNPPTPAPAG